MRLSPCKFKPEAIKEETIDDWLEYNMGCTLEPGSREFAEDLHIPIGGNAGIAGFCIVELASRALAAPGPFSGMKLSTRQRRGQK